LYNIPIWKTNPWYDYLYGNHHIDKRITSFPDSMRRYDNYSAILGMVKPNSDFWVTSDDFLYGTYSMLPIMI